MGGVGLRFVKLFDTTWTWTQTAPDTTKLCNLQQCLNKAHITTISLLSMYNKGQADVAAAGRGQIHSVKQEEMQKINESQKTKTDSLVTQKSQNIRTNARVESSQAVELVALF